MYNICNQMMRKVYIFPQNCQLPDTTMLMEPHFSLPSKQGNRRLSCFLKF